MAQQQTQQTIKGVSHQEFVAKMREQLDPNFPEEDGQSIRQRLMQRNAEKLGQKNLKS